MAALEAFYPYILPRVMGIADPVVDAQMILAAREFCERTSTWKEWLSLRTADGERFRFDHDAVGSELIRYTRAVVNDLDDYEVKDRSALPPDWVAGTSCDLDEVVVHLDREEFVVFPTPSADDTIRMEAVFKPSYTAQQLPDFLLADHAEAIADGTLAKVMKIAGQSWTNLPLAVEHYRLFRDACDFAANAGFVQRTRRVTKPCP